MSFHVPERSRNTTHPQLGTTAAIDGNNGVFEIESPEPGWRLSMVVSDGTDPAFAATRWEHVSVHAWRGVGKNAQLCTPTWKEMAFVKDLFWDGEDVVMQLHPKRSEYVNNHPHVLHLWRPLDAEIPTPPAIFVGVPSTGVSA
jgi:hypothetical protein